MAARLPVEGIAHPLQGPCGGNDQRAARLLSESHDVPDAALRWPRAFFRSEPGPLHTVRFPLLSCAHPAAIEAESL
eukprot:1159623-Pelagomonas_calceolata.AAC.13